MNQNYTFWKIINLFWILLTLIPFFNGLGFIYAGWRVNETKWIDEGIIYMIPFIFLSFTIMNDPIIYLELLLFIICIIRALMIIKPFLIKLEEQEHKKYIPSQNTDLNTGVYKNQNIKDVIDINNVSVEDLKKSGLFDNYKIEQINKLRKEGYTFKSLEDLSQKLQLTQSEIDEIRGFIKINKKISNSRILDI